MKTLWGYISAAAFLAITLMIGFLTLHVIFFLHYSDHPRPDCRLLGNADDRQLTLP